MRGNQIESLVQIGQGNIGIDPRNDSTDLKQLERVAKKLMIVQIKAKHLVAEKFADIEEITRAAAEVENGERRRTIEPDILRAFDVDPNPVWNICESIDGRRIQSFGVALA